jgi:hypothetical protein
MRDLLPELEQIIDQRLHGMTLDLDPRKLLLQVAGVLTDVREIGNNSGKMVELIQETIGGHSHESWCMGFVQSCVAYVERKYAIKSLLHASESCMDVWTYTPREQRVKILPAPGAVAIWRHGDTWKGHTGLVKLYVPKIYMNLIEGNTNAGDVNGKIVREGGGVYPTKRKIGTIGDMKLVGFLKPF